VICNLCLLAEDKNRANRFVKTKEEVICDLCLFAQDKNPFEVICDLCFFAEDKNPVVFLRSNLRVKQRLFVSGGNDLHCKSGTFCTYMLQWYNHNATASMEGTFFTLMNSNISICIS